MQKIIYASRAVRAMGSSDLEELLRVSRARNEEVAVTGLLLYCAQSFLQVLEGEPDAVERTYDRILDDERHTQVRLLAKEPIDERRFAAWSMGFEHPDEDDLVQTLPGYTPATTYPLVSSDLVSNAGIAQTLLELYARNAS